MYQTPLLTKLTCWLINLDMAPNSPAGLEVLAPAQGGEPQGCMDSKIREASLCCTKKRFYHSEIIKL